MSSLYFSASNPVLVLLSVFQRGKSWNLFWSLSGRSLSSLLPFFSTISQTTHNTHSFSVDRMHIESLLAENHQSLVFQGDKNGNSTKQFFHSPSSALHFPHEDIRFRVWSGMIPIMFQFSSSHTTGTEKSLILPSSPLELLTNSSISNPHFFLCCSLIASLLFSLVFALPPPPWSFQAEHYSNCRSSPALYAVLMRKIRKKKNMRN